MEDIKVGEHVRTKKGTIDIFKEKDENGLFARCEKNTYWMPDIVKHSKHIIDVIEVRRLCEFRKSIRYKRRIYKNDRKNTQQKLVEKQH